MPALACGVLVFALAMAGVFICGLVLAGAARDADWFVILRGMASGRYERISRRSGVFRR